MMISKTVTVGEPDEYTYRFYYSTHSDGTVLYEDYHSCLEPEVLDFLTPVPDALLSQEFDTPIVRRSFATTLLLYTAAGGSSWEDSILLNHLYTVPVEELPLWISDESPWVQWLVEKRLKEGV